MTQRQRWLSFKPQGPGGLLLVLGAVACSLAVLSPVVSPSTLFSSPVRVGSAHLFFALILWTFLWHGPFWGWATAGWFSAAVGVGALASRQFSLIWLSAQFLLAGWMIRSGIARWKGRLGEGTLEQERLQEEANTLQDQVSRWRQDRAGLEDRLARYQQLRQVANLFSASFSLEELAQNIVQVTGQLATRGDLALLYLVDRKSLTLELKNVWRRSGEVTIKAKRGDPFDLWVMRQGQPLWVEDPQNDFRFPQISSQELGRRVGALVSVPLSSEDRLLGVLRVESFRPFGLGLEDLRFVRILGDLASLGIENSQLYQRMLELAITDDLTGLAVRKHFQRRMSEEIARSRLLNLPVCLLLIDIDRFKVYNDTFGHSAGDKLLRHLAGLLRQAQRPGEVAARFGGEEFVLLLPGHDRKGALRRAEAIRAQVEQSQVTLRRSVTRTTVSIGVAGFPRDGETPEALLQRADSRLYQAKAEGRNRICCD